MSDGVVITEERKATPDGCHFASKWEGKLKFDKSGGSQYPDDVEFQMHRDGSLEITCDNGFDAIASFMCGPDEIARLAAFTASALPPKPVEPKKLWYEVRGVGHVNGGILFGLLMKEHPGKERRLEPKSVTMLGTGYAFHYRILNAFPGDLHPHEDRIAFCHLDGIIWDRSCRWPDPQADNR